MNFYTDKSECGNLLNNSYGGAGILGYKYTKEQKEKCSRKGEQNGMYGKTGSLSPHYGKSYSQNHKDKIRTSNPKRKRCYCKELDRSFNSFREAEKILYEEYGIICSHASISEVCSGRTHHAGRYVNTNECVYLHFKKI